MDMGTYTYQRTLPSCMLSAGTLTELERRLCNGIPRLLNKDLTRIMKGLGVPDPSSLQKFSIGIDGKASSHTLDHASELTNGAFCSGTRRVEIYYRLAAPNLIEIEMTFPEKGRPYVRITSRSPQVQKHFRRIADGLSMAIRLYGNRNRLLHNQAIQSVVMLSIPAIFAIYGHWMGIDPFSLYTSMGWLCLLACGVTMTLPRLFPWVDFETKRRFQFTRLPLLASISITLVALACYMTLVFYGLPRAISPYLVVAGLG
jgi:hypothetical protein